MLEFVEGDLFEISVDIRVNTVNCVGVMGAGVALAFKKRYPQMYRDYQRDCKRGLVKPGAMNIWKSLTGDWVINFPTKRHWRDPSRYDDIEAGLVDLRSYLDSVGDVSVALPALGCGHGGLDWQVVSQMIRSKLDGVVARVYVFKPAASLQAGRASTAPLNDAEQSELEILGYRYFSETDSEGWSTSRPLIISGDQELVTRPWISIMPSRTPCARELKALQAVATELSRIKLGSTVALVYSSRVSEGIAASFMNEGIGVVLILPFGVLTRRALARLVRNRTAGSLALISIADARDKWSVALLTRSMEALASNAESILISDPDPQWLANKGAPRPGERPVAYIRYEATPTSTREFLDRLGASPIGRRGEAGIPNIEPLVAKTKSPETSKNSTAISDHLPHASIATTSAATLPHHIELEIKLGLDSAPIKREVLDALREMASSLTTIRVELSTDASEKDLIRLANLGFAITPPQPGPQKDLS